MVALVLVSLISLVGAGCGSNTATRSAGSASNPGSASATGSGVSSPSSSHAANPQAATRREKAVKFAECVRAHGVPHFPDPDATGDFNFAVDVSATAFTAAVNACKALQPPGILSSHRSAKQQSVALRFAQCVRANGVPDFPDPVNGQPLIDTDHIPSSNQPGGMSILNAATHKCGGILGPDAQDAGRGVRRMRRKIWVPAAVLAAVAVIGGVLVMSAGKGAVAAPRPLPVGTTRVEKRTLSAMVSQGGILTYRARSDGSPYAVINQAHGTYTGLPTVGQVIRQGHALYRVNERSVVLLYGSTPAYRTLSEGATGPDVAELNADLVALGYATRAQLRSGSAVFESATTAAVQKLQAALGVAHTGRLSLGQAVVEPVAVRVTSVPVQPGGSAQPGETVLQGTSTTRQVQVALDASQQTSMAVGNRVSITLPNNETTPGVVSSVATVASCPSSSGAGGSGSSSATAGTDTCASGSTPTITVDVTLSAPRATGAWDQAPVQVGITTGSVRDALVVPVTALLAQAAGGYAVEVAGTGSGTNHLVPVSLGLFDDADGLVQVTGSGLAAGQAVVAPST